MPDATETSLISPTAGVLPSNLRRSPGINGLSSLNNGISSLNIGEEEKKEEERSKSLQPSPVIILKSSPTSLVNISRKTTSNYILI